MRLFTTKQVSRMGFGSPASINRWVKNGQFPAPIHVGKRGRRFSEESLRAYVETGAVSPAQDAR